MAGLTMVAIAVPEQIATAKLAYTPSSRLADGFTAGAEHETDLKQRIRLRKAGRTLSGTGRDLAVEVAADVIARPAGLD